MAQPNTPPASAAPLDGRSVLSRNARYGLLFFLIYVILYGGFMGLCAFATQAMAKPAIGGVNLAIVYGLGLILGAIVLALVYLAVCRGDETASEETR